ncbi:MAG: hypothetical protein AAF797_12210 [Planctomycetota bacterium]
MLLDGLSSAITGLPMDAGHAEKHLALWQELAEGVSRLDEPGMRVSYTHNTAMVAAAYLEDGVQVGRAYLAEQETPVLRAAAMAGLASGVAERLERGRQPQVN